MMGIGYHRQFGRGGAVASRVTCRRQRRYAEADTAYRGSLEMAEQVLGDRHPRLATMSLNYGKFLMERGEAKRAGGLLRRSLRIRRETGSTPSGKIAEVESLLRKCMTGASRDE